jgi:hypothetical protein
MRDGYKNHCADRDMRRLVVNMDERPSDIRQYLYLILQLLTDVMRLP